MKSAYWREIWPIWASVASILLTSAFSFILVATPRQELWDNIALVKNPSATTATIVETTVGNHCRIAYEFDLGGKRYHHDGKRCEAKLKQQIPIYYLASNPDVSMGEPPARVLGNFLVFFLVFVLMASALISTKFWQRRNRDSRMKVNR